MMKMMMMYGNESGGNVVSKVVVVATHICTYILQLTLTNCCVQYEIYHIFHFYTIINVIYNLIYFSMCYLPTHCWHCLSRLLVRSNWIYFMLYLFDDD